jgi:hypothetical protein
MRTASNSERDRFEQTTVLAFGGLTLFLAACGGGPEERASNDVGEALSAAKQENSDYNGDRRSDLAIYRPSASGNTMYVNVLASKGWGVPGDVPVVGDWDGDNKTDIMVWRPSNGVWYPLLSSTGFSGGPGVQWGAPGDIPLAGDYDGDGKSDRAIFRNGTWYVFQSSNGAYWARGWGEAGDVPVSGDFDGDGKSDLVIWRPSTGVWWILTSSSGFSWSRTQQWGAPGDIPITGDYDGDGITDFAVFRPSQQTFYLIKSASGMSGTGYGLSTDIPVSLDVDGDGKTDIAVYRPSDGQWFAIESSTGAWVVVGQYGGATGDIPVSAPPHYIAKMAASPLPPPPAVVSSYTYACNDGSRIAQQIKVSSDGSSLVLTWVFDWQYDFETKDSSTITFDERSYSNSGAVQHDSNTRITLPLAALNGQAPNFVAKGHTGGAGDWQLSCQLSP